MVLIRGHGDEGRLVKDMSTVGSVFGSKGVVFVRFDDVESWLVFVHRVQDDLEKTKEGNITFMKTLTRIGASTSYFH